MVKILKNKINSLSESHTQLAKNAFYIFALRTAQRIFGLATIYVLVRVLDQSSFGEYQFILSIVGLFTVTTLPGLNNAIMQSVSRGYEGTYRAAIPYSMVGSIGGAFLLLGMGAWYHFHGSLILSHGFIVSAVLFPLAHGLTQWRGLKAGREDFSGVFKTESFFAFLSSILIISLVLLNSGNIVIPIAIVLGIRSIQNILITTFTLKTITKTAPIEPGSIHYGLKTTINAFIIQSAHHIDKILLFFFMSPTTTALYFAAERISTLLKNSVKSLAGAVGPRFSRHKYYAAHVDKALKLISLLSAIGAIIFAFTVLPPFITFLFGEDYTEAIPYSQALICISVISFYTILRNRFIRSQLDEKSLRAITLSAASSRILTSLILVPLYGIAGAIVANLVQTIVAFITVHIIMKKKYPVRDKKNVHF